MSLWSRLAELNPFKKSLVGAEGSWRGPFMGVTEFGNWRELGSLEDGFQRNLSTREAAKVPAVYAAVMMSARAVSQCSPAHIRKKKDGNWETIETSTAARVIHRPNSYENWCNMSLNTVAEMLFNGESCWFCTRDDRGQIESVHRLPYGSWTIQVAPDTQAIYYGISKQNDLVDIPDYLVSAADIAHFRMATPRHPLVGESPIKAAALSVGLNVALSQSQLAFFSQLNRPSGVITTEKRLGEDEIDELRAAFDAATKRLNQGGVPILSDGFKFEPVGVAQSDAQLIEQQKLTVADIARVYGVPMALMADSGAPQAGTEALITHWLSVGLGSVIETMERTLDGLFDLDRSNSIQLDPTPLLRVDLQGRIEALTKAVQGGVMTPDEARAREKLGPIEGGDRAFLQRQMTPVDFLRDLAQQELKNPNQPPAATEPEADPEVVRALVSSAIREKKMSYDRKH